MLEINLAKNGRKNKGENALDVTPTNIKRKMKRLALCANVKIRALPNLPVNRNGI